MNILSKKSAIIELNKILNYTVLDTDIKDEKFKAFSYFNILDPHMIDYKLPRPVTITSIVSDILDYMESDDNDIPIDVEDINCLVEDKDFLVMSSAKHCAHNAAKETIQRVVEDIESNDLSLINSDCILICFQVNADYPLMELSEGLDIINSKWCQKFMLTEPKVIFGTSCNNNLENNYVKTTMFVSYSQKESLHYVNNLEV